jgi:hypothetical protein
MFTAKNKAVMGRGPCNKHKEDLCQSVRNQILLLQASSPVSGMIFSELIAISAGFQIPLVPKLFLSSGISQTLFLPSLKVTFPHLSQILRI